MAENLIFKKVKCNGFLKPVNDGRFIAVDQSALSASYMDTNKVEVEFNENTLETSLINDGTVGQCECEGIKEFLKTYMQPVKQEFSGVVVGIKNIIVNAWLCANVFYSYGKEYVGVYKEPNEVKECAIVYYANNRKHYVPLECIVDVKE